MQWIRFAALIPIAAILQKSLVNIFAFSNITPDLLLILLVFFAIYSNTTEAIIASFVIGFTADLIGPAMGPQMVSFGIFGTLLACLHRVITIRKMPYQGLAIFFMTFFTGALAHYLTFIKGQPTEPGIYTFLFGAALYSGIAGPFLFLPCAWWMRIKIRRLSSH